MDTVTRNTKVSIAYRLKDTNGHIIEEMPLAHPFVYVHGYENIIAGLEEALEGRKAGESFTVGVSYEKGYGAYRQDLVIEVAKDELQDIGEIWVGMELEMYREGDDSPEFSVPEDPKDIYGNRDEDDPEVYVIREIKDKTVTLDGNHPFAGMDLSFEVTVVSVEEPSITELETGFPDESEEDDDDVEDGDDFEGGDHNYNSNGSGRHWR